MRYTDPYSSIPAIVALRTGYLGSYGEVSGWDWTNSNYINTGSNELAVGQVGNQAVLFLNGQRATNSISLESVGKDVRVGVMGGNFGILSTTIRFDNFLVTNAPK